MKRLLIAVAILALAAPAAQAATSRWLGSWAAAISAPRPNSPSFKDQTVRQTVRLSAGGKRLRVRLTNEYGTKPLVIGAARIVLVGADGAPIAGTERALTVGGMGKFTIPQGAPMISDPVDLPTPALATAQISLYLPEDTGPCSCHVLGMANVLVSPPGDFTGKPFAHALPQPLRQRPFVSAVEVDTDRPGKSIIFFGDSITDGYNITIDSHRRWPDILAERLVKRSPRQAWGVVNAAISGNRVLSPGSGDAALARFDRDVLSAPGAAYLVVFEGVNDIGMGRDARPPAEVMIAGYKQIIDRARAHGLKVYGATIIPFEGAAYYTPAGEEVRQAVNTWIRTSGAFDAVIDFDKVIRDPANPRRMVANLQSGDWLHPNDAGYRVLGEAVDLKLFR